MRRCSSEDAIGFPHAPTSPRSIRVASYCHRALRDLADLDPRSPICCRSRVRERLRVASEPRLHLGSGEASTTTVPWLIPEVTTLRRGNVCRAGPRAGQNCDSGRAVAQCAAFSGGYCLRAVPSGGDGAATLRECLFVRGCINAACEPRQHRDAGLSETRAILPALGSRARVAEEQADGAAGPPSRVPGSRRRTGGYTGAPRRPRRSGRAPRLAARVARRRRLGSALPPRSARVERDRAPPAGHRARPARDRRWLDRPPPAAARPAPARARGLRRAGVGAAVVAGDARVDVVAHAHDVRARRRRAWVAVPRVSRSPNISITRARARAKAVAAQLPAPRPAVSTEARS